MYYSFTVKPTMLCWLEGSLDANPNDDSKLCSFWLSIFREDLHIHISLNLQIMLINCKFQEKNSIYIKQVISIKLQFKF
jgi:hypothetical protein